MDSVTISELDRKTAATLARVRDGEIVQVTKQGDAAVYLVPKQLYVLYAQAVRGEPHAVAATVADIAQTLRVTVASVAAMVGHLIEQPEWGRNRVVLNFAYDFNDSLIHRDAAIEIERLLTEHPEGQA